MVDAHLLDDLLESCKSGERRAQERLYLLLAPQLYGLCIRYASDANDAQETLQVGFIKIFKSISSFRTEGSFEGWARRVMVNTAIESYNKRKVSRVLLDLNALKDFEGSFFEMEGLEVQDLLKIIHGLPQGFRRVFNMFAIEGYSHKEIAEALGISEGTSKSQLSRARGWLKEKIKVMEGDVYGDIRR